MADFDAFKDVLATLDINTYELGCAMLACEPLNEKRLLPSSFLYTSPNPEHKFIKGWVADKPHITLKYGFLRPAYEWSEQIKTLLSDWIMPDETCLAIDHFEAWYSPYKDEQYAAIVGVISDVNGSRRKSDYHDPEQDPRDFARSLNFAYDRLSLLPHIDTFNVYKPHMTIAYVNAEDASTSLQMLNGLRNSMISVIPSYLDLGEE